MVDGESVGREAYSVLTGRDVERRNLCSYRRKPLQKTRCLEGCRGEERH